MKDTKNLKEINQEIQKILEKFKKLEKPDLNLIAVEKYVNELREVLEKIKFPCKMNISLNILLDSKNAVIMRSNLTVKKIKVLNNGWIEIKTEEVQKPRLQGWAKDFIQLNICEE
jgi:uncharacterized protein YejL (UPF0352 family)